MYYVPYYAPIHPGRIFTTFAFICSVVETLNGNGAAYVSNNSLSQNKQEIGHNLLRAGLAIQLDVIVSFFSLAIYFQSICQKHGLTPRHLRSVLTTLYFSSTVVLIRTIYRTFEYFVAARIYVVPGFDPLTISPVIRYEWFFWVFEVTIMLANSILLNFRHPEMYLSRNNKIYSLDDGVTEIEGPGFEDKRPILVTCIDPFDIIGLFQGRDKKTRYWENHERIVPLNGGEELDASTTNTKSKKEAVTKSPWSLFKLAFLTDRGQQGQELYSARKMPINGNIE
jgi:hypothetical protein